MKIIPRATEITLTHDERAVLEALSRSGKSEARMQQRARIGLLASTGTPSREIGRVVGCTTGTASKWRVRYARDYTPTHASWLNQIESWFSILGRQSLRGASFHSVEQLRTHIDSFIDSYNQDARPFVWTKSKVHQKRLKPRFADH